MNLKKGDIVYPIDHPHLTRGMRKFIDKPCTISYFCGDDATFKLKEDIVGHYWSENMISTEAPIELSEDEFEAIFKE